MLESKSTWDLCNKEIFNVNKFINDDCRLYQLVLDVVRCDDMITNDMWWGKVMIWYLVHVMRQGDD